MKTRILLLLAGALVLVGQTFSINGPTDNSAMSYAAQGQNNGCDPLANYQAGQGSNFAAVGISGCVTVPSSSTNQGALGIFGSVTNSSTTTNAVAGYFPAFAGAAGSGSSDAARVRIWGINPLLADRGFSNVFMSNELDFNVTAAGTKILGLQFTGTGTQDMSSDSAGIIFGALSGHKWPTALQCTDGATSVACIQLGVQSTANNQSSQVIRMISRSSTGSINFDDISLDPSGNLKISPAGGNAVWINKDGTVKAKGFTTY